MTVAKKTDITSRSHDDAMAEFFRKDPTYAVSLLNAVLADGEPAELLIVLRQMAKAFGGVTAIAEKANLNPTQLYRTLSEEGNPSLSSLTAILKAMGLRLAVEKNMADAA
jgi:probable addiction module antidote protein